MTTPARSTYTPLADEPGAREVTDRRTVYSGMVWNIVRDSIAFAPGVRFDREYVQHTGAVAVLAVDDQDRLLLIRQYRHPVGYTLWEIPAGLRDKEGEQDDRAALRELAEETGHEAGTLATLLDLRPSPGGSDEVIRIYLATDVRRADIDDFVREDEESELEVRWVPLEEVLDGIFAGRLTSGTLVTAVLAFHAHRTRGGTVSDLRSASEPWPEVPRRSGT